MKSKFDVITIGSAVRDIMFRTDAADIIKNPKADPTKLSLIGFEYGAKIHSQDVHRFYGGGAVNTAVCFARLGLHVAACVRVGDDADGHAIAAHLRSEHVNTSLIRYDRRQPTGLSFLVVESQSNEHVALVNYGANDQLAMTKQMMRRSPPWYYVSSLSTARWPQLVKQLLRTKAKLAWNPGAKQLAQPKQLQPLLKNIAVLILNNDEATELSQRTKLQPASFGSEIVVVTNGRHGATAYQQHRKYVVKPRAIQPKDTTGAGDAFGASFVAGLIRHQGDLQAALRLAIRNATAEVTQLGAQHGLLTWNQLHRK